MKKETNPEISLVNENKGSSFIQTARANEGNPVERREIKLPLKSISSNYSCPDCHPSEAKYPKPERLKPADTTTTTTTTSLKEDFSTRDTTQILLEADQITLRTTGMATYNGSEIATVDHLEGAKYDLLWQLNTTHEFIFDNDEPINLIPEITLQLELEVQKPQAREIQFIADFTGRTDLEGDFHQIVVECWVNGYKLRTNYDAIPGKGRTKTVHLNYIATLVQGNRVNFRIYATTDLPGLFLGVVDHPNVTIR